MLIILKIILVVIILFLITSRIFTLPCPPWLGWLVEMDNPFSKINRSSAIIEHLDLKQGMVVTDIGCGPGRLTIPLSQKVGAGGRVVALDIQQKMLDKVQAKSKKLGLENITFLHAGIGAGKLAPSMFDRVILVTVLGEIPNQKEALEEIFKSLKPGGILSITEIILDTHYQRLGKVEQLATSVGFKKKDLFSDWCAYNLLLVKE